MAGEFSSPGSSPSSVMNPSFLTLDGRRLETAWYGPPPDRAPTLVLLHEGLGSVSLWRDTPQLLADASNCGVLAYSRFGYGQSDPVSLPRPMTYMHDEALHVLPRVLDAAGIRTAIMIGHSDGGSIAAIHAGATQDERLAGLVLVAAHFIVEDLNIAAIAEIRRTYERGELRQRLARYHRDVDTAFYGWNDAWLDPRFRDFDISEYLPRIRVPILALQGADDPYGSEEQLHVLQRHACVPLDIRLVPGARHSPHLEAREATLAAITGFVAQRLRETVA